jgi:hypothetical protein
MAKKLMYFCCALGVLVMALHFTGDTAHGQGVGTLVAMIPYSQSNPIIAVDAAGGIYYGPGCFGPQRPFTRVGQLPSGAIPTCMVAATASGGVEIGCANGDIYWFNPDPAANGNPGGVITPYFCGNVLAGSPVTTQHESWGHLKARFAPTPAPVSQTPTNR